METTKPLEEKKRKEKKRKKNKTCAVSFTQNIGLNLDTCFCLLVVFYFATMESVTLSNLPKISTYFFHNSPFTSKLNKSP
jgi:hypothetical protein